MSQQNNNFYTKLVNNKDKVLLDLLFYDIVYRYADNDSLKYMNYNSIKDYFNVDFDRTDISLNISGSNINVDIKDPFLKWLLVQNKIGILLRLSKLLSFENKTLKYYYNKNIIKKL